MKILFVCTGNTCRSPMAKHLFEKYLSDRKITNITCDSAGTAGFREESAAKNAVNASLDYGVDLKNHKSKNLFDVDINSIDLFVVMSFFQHDILMDLNIPDEKIYVLDGGIEDPFGGNIGTYKKCCDKINSSFNNLYEYIISMGE